MRATDLLLFVVLLIYAPALAQEPPTPADRLGTALALQTERGLDAVRSLAVLAEDDDPWVRRTAILALGERREPAQERRAAAQALLGPLMASDAETRETATIAAGQLGATELLTPLADRLEDADPRVAYHAIGSLQVLGDPSALAPLAAVLSRDDPALRQRALIATAALGQVATPGDALHAAAVAVAALAQDNDGGLALRQHAILTLGALTDPVALAALVELTESTDPTLAAQAKDALLRSARQPEEPR